MSKKLIIISGIISLAALAAAAVAFFLLRKPEIIETLELDEEDEF